MKPFAGSLTATSAILWNLLVASNAVAVPPAIPALPPASWERGGVYSVALACEYGSCRIAPNTGRFHFIKVVSVGDDPCALVFEREESSRGRLTLDHGPQILTLRVPSLLDSVYVTLDPRLVVVEPITRDEIRWCRPPAGGHPWSWEHIPTQKDELVRDWLLEGCGDGRALPGMSTGAKRGILPRGFELVMERGGSTLLSRVPNYSVTVLADGSVTFRDESAPLGRSGRRLSAQRRSRLAGALCRIGFFELGQPCPFIKTDNPTADISVRIGGKTHRVSHACGGGEPAEIRGLLDLVDELTGAARWADRRQRPRIQ